MDIYTFRRILSRAANKGLLIAWLTLFILFSATIYFYLTIKNNTIENAKTQFNFQTEEIVLAIKKRMAAYEQILKSGIGLFKASDGVRRDEWNLFYRTLNIEGNFPGILGFGYSEIIKPENLDEHINKIRSEGFQDYLVWPLGKRDIYTSIIYLEPFKDRNLRAFGYDMFSEPIRREAMIIARDSGKVAVSGRIKLVQETDKDVQSGFLMFVPLYKKDAPIETVEERREAILGYVYSPFRMNDLIEGILEYDRSTVKFEVFDGKHIMRGAKIYDSQSKDEQQYESLFKDTVLIPIRNHSWNIVFSSLPEFDNSIDVQKHRIVLIMGLAISLLVFLVAISLLTTRKLYKKNELILDSSGEGLFGIDLRGRCTFINRAASQMLLYDARECIGRDIHQLIHHTKIDGTPYKSEHCPIITGLETKNFVRISDEIFWRSDGTNFFVEYSSNPIIQNGVLRGAVVTFNDITERKRANDLLEDSLKEKDILLREVHHRVKNNMQIVSSLLNLQSGHIHNEEVLGIFKESQNRIRSMALVHEKLYQSKEISKVKLKDYVNDLTNHLISSYNTNACSIKSEIITDEIYIGIDVVIYVGLIINELFTNSLKHAFKNKLSGNIEIFLREENSTDLFISIKDNGEGLPDNFSPDNNKSLGLLLVISLVEQFEGKFDYVSNGGAEFIITFPNVLTK